MFSYHGANGQNQARRLFRRVRQVAVPVGRRTTTAFGWVRQNAAPGAKSSVYNCLVYEREKPTNEWPFSYLFIYLFNPVCERAAKDALCLRCPLSSITKHRHASTASVASLFNINRINAVPIHRISANVRCRLP